MYKIMIVLAVLATLPSVTLAQAPARTGFVDVYFVPSANLDVTGPGGSVDDDGDGFGFRGLGLVSDEVALTAEFQSVEYDDFEVEADQLRFGVGLIDKTTSGVFIEYVDADIDGNEADGFGLHGRLARQVSDTVLLYGQAGYLSIKDDFEKNEGLEFSLGAVVSVNEKVGLFADFRRTSLEGKDSEIELEFTDIRVGVRISL